MGGADWRLAQAPPGGPAEWGAWEAQNGWLPATVPGDVRADLMRAGRIPDLSFGCEFRASQWVDEAAWWLVRDFQLAPAVDRRAHLVLRGVDYLSDLFLNGVHLARHEGMFSPIVCDVTPHLGHENRLAIRLEANARLPTHRSGLVEKGLNRLEARWSSLPELHLERRDVLKCQMGFGWDFAPPVRSTGVWDEVYLQLSGPVCIRSVAVQSAFEAQAATVQVSVELDATRAGPISLRATLEGVGFEDEPVQGERWFDLPLGTGQHTLCLRVPEPRLWWPWDHGAPDQYRLRVEVRAGSSTLSDVWEDTVGLRSVALEGWTMCVNGRPVYLRGANWVPLDLLPGRLSAADYQPWLDLARRANMNALRVWGGGLREKRAFYDLCDRLGILVWQEFPFACASITRYPRGPEYLALVRAEVGAIVRDLRNHPSIGLWCGGNEFSPRRNRHLIKAMGKAVADCDATRPFLPVSPQGDDSHFWDVWHSWEPPGAYRRDRARFASEFGLQAVPNVASAALLPAEDLWPPGPGWSAHGADLIKLRRYAEPWPGASVVAGREQHRGPRTSRGPPAGSALHEFVQASQRAQAEGLKIAIEHYRRRKADGAGGALVWQLNEPWPAVSWSLVDAYRTPKLAYDTVRQLFSPVLVSLDHPVRAYRPGDPFCPIVWLINDSPTEFRGCRLRVELVGNRGEVALEFEGETDLPPLSAQVAARFCWTLPRGAEWQVVASAAYRGHTLSVNRYHLADCDQIRPSLRQRLRSLLGRWIKAL